MRVLRGVLPLLESSVPLLFIASMPLLFVSSVPVLFVRARTSILPVWPFAIAVGRRGAIVRAGRRRRRPVLEVASVLRPFFWTVVAEVVMVVFPSRGSPLLGVRVVALSPAHFTCSSKHQLTPLTVLSSKRIALSLSQPK